MDFFTCIETRRSSRAFEVRDVDKEILERILQAANRCPSYMNTQPWEVFVVTGNKKKYLSQKLYEMAEKEMPRYPDIPFPSIWPHAMQQRTITHRNNRFQALGIDPEMDTEKIKQGMLKNFKFFDAPCVVFIVMNQSLTPWSVFDLGAFVHGFLLALHAEGVGGVPQAQPVSYPDIIREELNIPDSKYIILAISIGYPDKKSPVNQYISSRRDLGEFVSWVE